MSRHSAVGAAKNGHNESETERERDQELEGIAQRAQTAVTGLPTQTHRRTDGRRNGVTISTLVETTTQLANDRTTIAQRCESVPIQTLSANW